MRNQAVNPTRRHRQNKALPQPLPFRSFLPALERWVSLVVVLLRASWKDVITKKNVRLLLEIDTRRTRVCA